MLSIDLTGLNLDASESVRSKPVGGSVVDREAVLAANAAFYQAFEEGNIEVMFDMWEHTTRAACTHPGWPALHGWTHVAESWRRLIEQSQRPQFIITNERVEVEGDAAWVTCDENLLAGAGSGTVSALNVFVLTDGMWRLVAHHGSPVH